MLVVKFLWKWWFSENNVKKIERNLVVGFPLLPPGSSVSYFVTVMKTTEPFVWLVRHRDQAGAGRCLWGFCTEACFLPTPQESNLFFLWIWFSLQAQWWFWLEKSSNTIISPCQRRCWGRRYLYLSWMSVLPSLHFRRFLGSKAQSIFWCRLNKHDLGFAPTCISLIPLPWKEWHAISSWISSLFEYASLIYNTCADTATLSVIAGSNSIWDRKWQLFDKCNRVGIIKRTKVNFLFLKLIKGEVASQMFLTSSVLLFRSIFACTFCCPCT